MAEVNTSVTKDKEEGSLLGNKEEEFGQPKPSQKTFLEPPRPPEASIPPSTEGGDRAPPPVPNTDDRVVAGWMEAMEEALQLFRHCGAPRLNGRGSAKYSIH